MAPDSASVAPRSRRPLFLLLGLLAVVGIVYVCLPASWFEIPKETPAAPKSPLPRGAGQPPAAGAPSAPASIEALRATAQKTPLDYEARSRYGMALAAAHQPAEALEEFLAAARLAPESPIVHHNLGIHYLNQGQPDRADLAFQRELELAPGDARAHYYRGLALESMRHYPEAYAQLALTAKLAPNFPDTYLSLATLLTEKREPDEIKGYVDDYIRLGGRNKGLAYHALSRAYRVKQNYKEAIRYAEMATKEGSSVVLYWRNLGQLLSFSRQFDEADKILRQVAEMSHDPSPVYIEIGVNAQKAGRYPDAVAAYQKALQISPKTGNIHQYLSRAYLLMKDRENAQREEQAFRAWERERRKTSAANVPH